MATVIVTGLASLDRKLRELPAKIGNKVMRQSMREAMKPVLAAAKANVPVRSGTLKRNIKLRAGKRSRSKFKMTVGVGKKDFTGEAWYGAQVELGSSKQLPQSYLRRAALTHASSVKRKCRELIAAGIRREIKAMSIAA